MLKRTIPAAIILFLTMTLFLPGPCLAQNVSEATYPVIEELDVKVTMRDGVRLSTNIYRPDTTGKFPVLLARSPYGNGGEGNREAHFFARCGYAVVVQDTRGRYESEGIFDAFQPEALDGYDTQQWIGCGIYPVDACRPPESIPGYHATCRNFLGSS
jgi:predicted acyl esterase